MIGTYVPYLVIAVVAVAMVIELRIGKIPNWLSLLPFLLFIAVAASVPDRSVLIWQLVFAVAVFAAGLLLFAFAGFGAGAVKLMSGLALFIPLAKGWIALAVFIGSLFLAGLIIARLRKMVGGEDSAWKVMNSNVMPMTVPMMLTCIAVFFIW
jgi:prepilin peptidase CpaA